MGGRSTPRPAVLPPGKTRYPLYSRLGGPQGRSGQVRKNSPPPGFDPRIVQLVTSPYTNWAIPAHIRAVKKKQEKKEAWSSAIGPEFGFSVI